MSLEQYILVFLVTAFAGMYGLIFGGGGFLVLPTLFLLGIDPKVAVATNQLGSIGEMIVGSWIFIKNKKINLHSFLLSMPSKNFIKGLFGKMEFYYDL